MNLDERNIIGIVESASSRLGGVLCSDTIRTIKSQPFKDEVADATQAILVDGVSQRDDCVLIISNQEFPNFVNEAVEKALDAQSILGSQLGSVVCTPKLTGTWDSRSYALYERLEGYSQNKYLRKLQAIYSSDKIISWSAQVFHKTARQSTEAEDVDAKFLAPLQTLSTDNALDSDVRDVACTLESGLKQRQLRSFNCLEHGDFWIGNVLFKRGAETSARPNRTRFKVIDWAGSSPNGYPGMDALKFSMSAFGDRRISYRKLESYCRLTGLSKAEFGLSCLCALGRLAGNLNQFPKDRFNGLALRTTRFLYKYNFFTF